MPGFLSGMSQGMGGNGKDDSTSTGNKIAEAFKRIGGKIKGSMQHHGSQPGGGDATKATMERTSGDEFKKGGKVKRTGLAKVHKGERVLTKKQAKKYAGKKR